MLHTVWNSYSIHMIYLDLEGSYFIPMHSGTIMKFPLIFIRFELIFDDKWIQDDPTCTLKRDRLSVTFNICQNMSRKECNWCITSSKSPRKSSSRPVTLSFHSLWSFPLSLLSERSHLSLSPFNYRLSLTVLFHPSLDYSYMIPWQVLKQLRNVILRRMMTRVKLCHYYTHMVMTLQYLK